MLKKEFLHSLQEAGLVAPKGKFTLASGASSKNYFDVKGVCANYEIKTAIEDSLGVLILEHIPRISCIAGDAEFGPVLGGISSLYHLPCTLVRKEPKITGMERGLLDYYIPKENDVLAIIDDVFTTGKSIRRIIEAVAPTRAKIAAAYVLVQRGENTLDFPLYSMFHARDFDVITNIER